MKRSISTRMILQLMPAILVIFIALIASAILMTTNAQRELAYQQGGDNAQKFAFQFNTQLESGLTIGKTFAQTLAQYESQDRQEVARMAQNLLDQHPEIAAVYAGYEPDAFDGKDARFTNKPGSDASGRYVPNWNRYAGSPVLEPLLDLDISDYYLLPKTTRLEAVLEPFEYEGVMMTSYVSPILRDGVFLGIAGVDMSLAELDRQIKEIRSYTNGYAFLVSNGGTFISAPDESLIGSKTLSELAAEAENKQLAEMAAGIKAGTSGYIETVDPFTNRPSVMFYSPIPTGTLGLVSVVPVVEIMAGVNRLTMTMAIIGTVSLILLSVLVFFIARALAKPIVAVSQAAGKIARGELDIELNIRQQDEIGQMAGNFQTMAAYLRGIATTAQSVSSGDLRETVTPISDKDILGNAFAIMIAKLREQVRRVAQSAESLGAASTQLASAAQQAGQATGQIAATIQQVARGTSEQSETITSTAASVDQMGNAIAGVAKGAQEQASAVGKASEVTHQITAAIQEVSTSAKAQAAGAAQAVQTTRANARTVQETISGMNKIKTQVDLSTGKVQEMGQRSQQIGMIVETIEDIASQTNLLALNAAIEAARAGEHGKGFAVVADEVRKLAEKSAGATKEIAELVRGIQQTVGDAVQAMTESTSEVEEGVSLANQSGEALVSLMEAAETSQRSGEEIAVAAEQMTRMANELVSAMDSVSAVVEENTAATEEMAAGSSEVTVAIENIASVSEENSAAVEEVSASTEEMSAQVEEVNASAQSLAEMAQVLQQMVAMFQLPDEQAPDPGQKSAAPPTLPENGHKKNGKAVLMAAR